MLRFLTFLAAALLATAAQATQLFVNAPDDGFLNLRAGPSTGYAVLHQMPHGTEVQVIEAPGKWYRIRHVSGHTGWASSSYLGTWTQVQDTRRPRADDPALDGLRGYFVDAPSAGALNLRAGPGTDNAVITVMKQGSRVEELGSKGDWRLLRHEGGQVGWAHHAYLSDTRPAPWQPPRAGNDHASGGFVPAPGYGQRPGFNPGRGNGHGKMKNKNKWRKNGRDFQDDARGWQEDDRRGQPDDLVGLLLRCNGKAGDALARCLATGLVLGTR